MQTDAASLNRLGQSAAMSRAALLARGGRLAQAEALLLPLVADPHAPAAALDLLARVYAQQGRLEQARSFWSRALEAAPGDPRYRAARDRCDRLGRTASPLRGWRRGALARVALCVLAVALVTVLVSVVALQGREAGELRREARELRGEVARLAEQAGSSATTPAGTAPPLDLRARVAEALGSAPGLGRWGVGVAQEGRVVQLLGAVPTPWVRYLVEARAAQVAGVEGLDLRALKVEGRYAVQPGDTLWSIAARVYGSGWAWPELARANGMAPPYRLWPGQVLEVPVP